jgi:hypothetical protein
MENDQKENIQTEINKECMHERFSCCRHKHFLMPLSGIILLLFVFCAGVAIGSHGHRGEYQKCGFMGSRGNFQIERSRGKNNGFSCPMMNNQGYGVTDGRSEFEGKWAQDNSTTTDQILKATSTIKK